MERFKKQFLFVVLLALLCLPFVSQALPGHAVGPTSLWSQPITTNSLMLSNANDIYMGNCVINRSQFEGNDYHAVNGHLNWSISNQDNPLPCPDRHTAVVDNTGAFYTIGEDLNGGTFNSLVKYANGQLVWQITPDHGQILDLVLGASGNLYAVTADPAAYGLYLYGVAPNLAAGQTKPTVVVDKEISNSSLNSFATLFAYYGGLAVEYSGDNNSGAYFDYSGNSLGIIPTTAYVYESTASVSGELFLTALGNSQFCPSQVSNLPVLSTITAYGPYGTLWQHSLPACTTLLQIEPTLDGGAIALLASNDGIHPAARYFLDLKGDGTSSWKQYVPYVYNGTSFENPTFKVTDAGDVVMLQPYTRSDANDGVIARQYSGVTGNVVINDNFAPSPQTGGYSFGSSLDQSLAIGQGIMYVALVGCNWSNNGGLPSCGSNPTLYALSAPTVMLDYPRGVFLAGNQQTVNYVAMGDSFSSGEGNPPFFPPSDQDGCHRSGAAYPELLAEDYTLHLNLTFVACSGATTQNIMNTQTALLNGSTQLVTITGGGDDIDFKSFVSQCLLADCSKPSILQPYLDKVATLGPALTALYDTILQDAPNAQVYILGYPDIVPTNITCTYTSNTQHLSEWALNFFSLLSQLNKNDVSAILQEMGLSIQQIKLVFANGGKIHLTNAEDQAAQRLTTALDNKIYSMVGSVYAHLHYVDPTHYFAGHQLCTSSEYFNGVDLSNQIYSFHPNAAGQDAYRVAIQPYVP